uniref:Uncharacterized protein n=1 Tax=Chaetoceros debilis TaxID=122233 RepID=A0A7S3VD07_9STRA
MSKQKKASFETSVRSNRIVLASSIPIDLARMYFIQSPQSFADRSPTNHTQFLSCNLASLYFYQPLTFISDDIILFIVTKNGCEIATTLRTAFSSPLQPCTYVSSLLA